MEVAADQDDQEFFFALDVQMMGDLISVDVAQRVHTLIFATCSALKP